MFSFIRQLTQTKFKPMSWQEQKQVIESYPEPRDDFDRTLFHYDSRFCNVAERWKLWVLNFACLFATPVFLVIYLCRSLHRKEVHPHAAVLIHQADLSYRYDDKVPQELYEEFGEIYPLVYGTYPGLFYGFMSKNTFHCWRQLVRRTPFRIFQNFFCLVHLTSMCRVLQENQPKAVLNYRSEASFPSSVVTHLCEMEGCEFICFMHGDYLASKDRAFVRFSRMYLWDEHYRKMFLWSRCPAEQLRVYRPLIYQTVLPEKSEPTYYATYYFSGFDQKAEVILDVFKQCMQQGKKCKIRPHPRFSDIPALKALFEPAGIRVEEPLKEPIEESMADSQWIVARCSSVLTQAYYAGKSVMIDDMSDPDFFRDMKDYMYIMADKPHCLLSELTSGELHEN